MSKKYIIKKYNYENNSYLTIGSYDSWKETKAFCEEKIKELENDLQEIVEIEE